MKFLPLNNVLLLSTLFFSVFRYITCIPIGPSVSADERRDLDICIAACKNFRHSLVTFLTQLNTESYEAAKESFSTCQYRCYKCSMSRASNSMGSLELYKSNFAGEKEKFALIAVAQPAIIESVQLCRDSWIVAASLHCSKTPVEDAVDLFKNECIE